MIQTALNGVGQALLVGDKIRTTIKERFAGGEAQDGERSETARTPRTEEGARQAAGEPPARREPVIFAPRPSKAEKTGQPEKAEKAEAVTTEAPAEETTATETTATETTATETTPAETAPAASQAVESAEAVKAQTVETVEAAEAAESGAESTAATAPKAARTRRTPAAAVAEPVQQPVQQPVEQPVEQPRAEETAAGTPEPLPDYANLSLASLRARLRGKSAEQVHALLDYEKDHLNRPEVVRLFQNRLSKLQSES